MFLNHLLSSWSRKDEDVAHLTGFEPALSNAQGWGFWGPVPFRSLAEASAAIVMPWKSYRIVAGV